jgi:hypothetical protein
MGLNVTSYVHFLSYTRKEPVLDAQHIAVSVLYKGDRINAHTTKAHTTIAHR